MAEPMANIRMFCEKHAPKPDEKLAKVKAEAFVGRHVKIGFKTLSDPMVRVEHMWVKVKAIDVKAGKLVGNLANDPLFATHMKCGQRVTVNRDEIEAVTD